MFNCDYITKEETKWYSQNWPEILDYPHRMLIVWGSGSRKTNTLLNLINHKPDIDKIYFYTKDPYEAKHWLLINKRENTGLMYLNDLKDFIEYSNDMDGIYKNIEEYNPHKKWKILIVFEDMIADMLSNKKPNRILAALFNRRIILWLILLLHLIILHVLERIV